MYVLYVYCFARRMNDFIVRTTLKRFEYAYIITGKDHGSLFPADVAAVVGYMARVLLTQPRVPTHPNRTER